MRNHVVPKKDAERDEPDKNSERLREAGLWPASWVTQNSQFLVPIRQVAHMLNFLPCGPGKFKFCLSLYKCLSILFNQRTLTNTGASL